MSIDTKFEPSALEELAMFPLPTVVLFPGAVLPLHVFEPRYRAMTKDALDGTGLIAMARIREATEGRSPTVHPVAGVGRIQSARELEDGRYLLLLRGIARVAIEEELPETLPYRRVRALLLADDAPLSMALTLASEKQLITMCDQIASSLENASQLSELVRLGDSPGARADLIASALVRDPDHRQALLECLDPCARLDRLLEHVAHAMSEVGVERQLN